MSPLLSPFEYIVHCNDIKHFIMFLLPQPRIDEINTQARQKNREVMTIQNQARGARDEADHLKAQVQGDCVDICFKTT